MPIRLGTVFLVHICSALASKEVPFSISVDNRSPTCSLDGFQIDTLAQSTQWTVPFPRKDLDKCIIPDSYERHRLSSCRVHFSVCGTLPEGVCGEGDSGNGSCTACQEVVTDDGLRHYYCIGEESRESYEFKPNGDPSSESNGFFTVRHGSRNRLGPGCLGRFKISFKFVCEKERVWNPHSTDASMHLDVIVIIEGCHIEIVFVYSGACHKVLTAPTLTPATSSCQLPPYNLTGLTRYEYWYAHVPNLCYTNGYQSVHACTVYFAFCRPLPASVDGGLKLGPNCTGAAVCQTFVADNDRPPPFLKPFFYDMGRFDTFTGFSYNTAVMGGGFHMTVGNGSKIPSNGTCNMKTQIVFACNTSVEWSSQDLTKMVRIVKPGPCEYNIILAYNGACLPVFPNATVLPSTARPTVTTPSKGNSTSMPPRPTSSIVPPHTSSHHNSTITPSTSTSTRNSTAHPRPSSTMKPPHTSSRPNSTTTPSTSTHSKNSTAHPHPSSTARPPHTSSHRNSSSSPPKSSTVPTSPIHTSSRILPTNSTVKHPSTTIETSAAMRSISTSASARRVVTSMASFSPTPAPHVATTSPPPANPDRRIILGLATGVVLFAVLSVALLVVVIVVVRILIKKNRKLKFLKLDSQ